MRGKAVNRVYDPFLTGDIALAALNQAARERNMTYGVFVSITPKSEQREIVGRFLEARKKRKGGAA